MWCGIIYLHFWWFYVGWSVFQFIIDIYSAYISFLWFEKENSKGNPVQI